jgi:hypothetical protein
VAADAGVCRDREAFSERGADPDEAQLGVEGGVADMLLGE